jgi:hypothetical protein
VDGGLTVRFGAGLAPALAFVIVVKARVLAADGSAASWSSAA